MQSKNATSADNQQERQEINPEWISGFVDGEGCFSVSFIRNKTTNFGWQVFPEFVVTQGEKSRMSLELIKNYFQCGMIYTNTRYDNHRESLLRYCVRSRKDLREIIIPFFKIHLLRTAKSEDFKRFSLIIQKMDNNEHLNIEGLRQIAMIIQGMNRKVPSRFLESSETTCQISY